MILMTDVDLQGKGVAALGARNKLLKVGPLVATLTVRRFTMSGPSLILPILMGRRSMRLPSRVIDGGGLSRRGATERLCPCYIVRCLGGYAFMM
jgi:hypothetical protein